MLLGARHSRLNPLSALSLSLSLSLSLCTVYIEETEDQLVYLRLPLSITLHNDSRVFRASY